MQTETRQTFPIRQHFHNPPPFLISRTIKIAAADQKPTFPFCEAIWGFANWFHLNTKKWRQKVHKVWANVWLSFLWPFLRIQTPSNHSPPLACLAMQAASWPRGSVSITPQQQFHFPSEAKQFQSLEMFLITSVVYECYMISRVYIKNICSFQKFLNFSQNYNHKLTLQPLSLSSYTVFLNVT